MSFNSSHRKNAYKNLPEDIQNFVLSTEITEIVFQELQKLNLNSEIYDQADSEILDAMFRLQTLEAAISNIANLSGKKPEELAEIKKTLEDQIFSKLNSIPLYVPKTELEIPPNNLPTTNAGGNTAAEEVTPSSQSAQTPPVTPPQENKPDTQTFTLIKPDSAPEVTEIPKFTPKNNPITEQSNTPKYPGGIDPYREPTE